MNIIEQHYRENKDNLVSRLSRSFGLHNAEDIVQNAYEKAFKYLNTVHKLDNWFVTIVSNCVKDFLRDKITKGMNEEEYHIYNNIVADIPSSPEDEYIDKNTLYELIRSKHHRHRTVLDMYFIHNMNYAEIHEVLPDIKLDYLRKIISNFRKEIRNE